MLHVGWRALLEQLRIELAQTVDLSRWEFLRRVVIPGTLPHFLLGLRFAVTAAWLALVVVEQVNATSGIGYMMELARNYGQTDVWALRGQTCGTATRFARRYACRDAGGQLDGWRQERSWRSATDILETTFRKGRTRVLLILYVCNDEACKEWG